ncbi:MAG: hypothetical protein R2719_04130 [Micropruina sp.]
MLLPRFGRLLADPGGIRAAGRFAIDPVGYIRGDASSDGVLRGGWRCSTSCMCAPECGVAESARRCSPRCAVRRRGGGEMHINVDEIDVDARRFYERHGFVNIEPGTDYRMLCYIAHLAPPPKSPA